jgi:putative ABC transport system permease protein
VTAPPEYVPAPVLPPLQDVRRSGFLLFRHSILSALRSLATHKLRAALSVLAMVVGTLGVFAVSASFQAVQSSVAGQFAALQAQLISVTGWAGGPQQNVTSPPSLTAADIFAIERLPHVVAASPLIGVGGSNAVLVAGDRSWQIEQDGGIEGVFPGIRTIGGYTLQTGAFFTDQDVQNLATTAVLGATVAHGLFPDGHAVGQQFRLLNVTFTVTGVLSPFGNSGGRDTDNRIFVPATTLTQKVIGPIKGAKGPPPGAPADFGLMFVNLPAIQVMADSVPNVPTVQQEIAKALEQAHHLATGQPDDFSVAAFNQGVKAEQQSLATVQIVSAIIAAVALLLGGFGVANVLLAAVSERTREIGLRLAVGAEPADVRRQFLVEAVTLSLLGGVTGVAVGFGLEPVLSAIAAMLGVSLHKLIGGAANFFLPAPSLEGAALALAVTLALGLAFGSYPAHRAARLDPIQALRRV